MPTSLQLRREANAPTIAYEVHQPEGPVRGRVLLTHGFGEHRLRYSHVIDAWLKRGLLVLAYDLRGHGASEGRRGHVEHFSDYVDDGSALLDELERLPGAWGGAPSVVFGHSLGGLISIHLALRHPSRIRLLALSSPFLGLAMQVPTLKLAVGRAMSRYAPKFSLPSGISPTILTHDENIVRRTADDPLCVRTVSARWFTETSAAQEAALAHAAELCAPIFCLSAGDDRVALPSATRAFSLRVGSQAKVFRELPGQYHEILNELEREATIDLYSSAILAAYASDLPQHTDAQ
jgi:alpha-beta hydrolase superfamily lysophospholipase